MPAETVKVMVRCRPMNRREIEKNTFGIVQVESQNFQIVLTNPEDKDIQKVFAYDEVFPADVKQEDVYAKSAFSIIESVLEGYNGTIFAYGQTGCGKTHTMMGSPHDNFLKGIIPRAFDHVFGKISTTGAKNFLIRCSYIEIYNEEIHDLIGQDWNKKLDLKESPDKGIFIKDLMIHTVKSIPEIERLMEKGAGNRKVGETAMNKDSSRSHSIFTIYIETSCLDEKGNQRITAGKLNLVDLAGSERQSKTKATGERLKEAQKINLSLSALGNVISALVDGKSHHIPYRDSKLTRLLQDSLGGNTKTVMIANISPSSDNYDETLGTLRYASRAKNIKNQPKINQDPKDALLKEYADEIKRLRKLLEDGGSLDDADLEKLGLSNLGSYGDVGKGGAGSKKGRSNNNIDRTSTKEQKDLYEDKLKQKDQAMAEERKRREEMEAKLKEMQKNMGMVQGGQNDAQSAEEKKKYEDMSNQFKEREQQHEELLQAKKDKEEELLETNKKHSSLQEEVEDMRKKLRMLKKKYKNAAKEIEDLEREHEQDKEDLLDTIRLLDKDARVNAQIMIQVLRPEDLDKIKKKAKWVEDKNSWMVNPFLVRAGRVKFPKLSSYQQGVEMVKEDWKNREIEILEQVEEKDEVEEFWAKDSDINHLKEGSGLGMLKDVRSDLHRESQMSTNATFNSSKMNGMQTHGKGSIDKIPSKKVNGRANKLSKYNSREQLDEAPELETVGKTLIDHSPDIKRKEPGRLEPLSANVHRSNVSLYDKGANTLANISMMGPITSDKPMFPNSLNSVKPQGKLKPLAPIGKLK